MPEQYDLLVIGSGAAGSTAAETAARRGARVALVERDRLGGTCLNYGCDPTKALLHAARLLHQARHAGRYGICIPEASADWTAVRARAGDVVERIRGGSPEQARAGQARKGIDLLEGEARFISPHELSVSGRSVRAVRVIVATGAAPEIPAVEGLREAGYITNVEVVSLPELPRRMAIVGAGPVGIEFAQLFHRFGVQVTVLHRGPVPLDTEDREVAEMLCGILSEDGVRIETGVELRCVPGAGSEKRLNLRLKNGKHEELVADEVLLASGRRPALDSLDLPAAGVEFTAKGIAVSDTLRTNVPHIWAAGDVTGGYQLTHVASEQGGLAARNAFARVPRPYNARVTPWVTYTDPELARVGRTEEELRAQGIEYRVARMPFAELDRAIATGETRGLVKLLAARNGVLLGAHILGPAAGDLLAPIVLAMRRGLRARSLAETVLPYPTLAEAVRWAADRL
jgi:pyruvate/2-oxoglutarate dehydrogenase complex dihydrolipoamide dehydrogenase (E3) component